MHVHNLGHFVFKSVSAEELEGKLVSTSAYDKWNTPYKSIW
jgi:hypothetical protein